MQQPPNGTTLAEEIRELKSDAVARGAVLSSGFDERLQHAWLKHGFERSGVGWRRTWRSILGPRWLLGAGLAVALVAFLAPFTKNRGITGTTAAIAAVAAFVGIASSRRIDR